MRQHGYHSAICRPRSGKILVLFGLLLPVLLGMTGVVLDGGIILATHRQAQNAADAAALAAAMDKMRGKSNDVATATANTFVQQYNALANVTLTLNGGSSNALNAPPSLGAYAGSAQYVEAIVSVPVPTTFIQMLGVNSSQTVVARAVAGYEAVSSGEGVAVLDPTAIPGLSVQGGGTLSVNGRVVINSQGAGLDQNNQPVNLGYNKYAATTGNGSLLNAQNIYVVGGVDTPANYLPYTANGPNPLHAAALPEPDPLTSLPTPIAGMSSFSTTSQGSVQLTGGTTTLNPGIYSTIKITNSANVTFNPGIYVVASNSTNAITITGSGTIRGNGVMFYNTGSDYTTSSPPDASDGQTVPPSKIPGNPTFGDVTINGQDIQLTGLNDSSSPFNGMLFYQRRWNTNTVSIQGNGAANQLQGSMYARWAQFKVSGSGTYGAQFIAGSLAVTGGANITLNYAGKNLGKANQVYLVE